MKGSPKVAVILFPGTNCELEALRACKRAKMKAELFRWNDNKAKLKNFDAFIIPGGFSYEDRGRSGIVAAKDPIMDSIAQEAFRGKPVLGICNGAQILVETGLVPGIRYGQAEMALTYNQRVKKGKILGTGFYNDWVYMRSEAKPKRSPYNFFTSDTILHIPLAHGEGRFAMDKKTLEDIKKHDQTLFRYCDKDGNFIDEFPTNPNGAIYNLAGVCNREGNVLSLMPHPERTINGQPIFDSLAEYLNNNTRKLKHVNKVKPVPQKHENLTQKKTKPDIVITVKLVITDNEERTMENAAKRMGLKDIQLKKRIYFGLSLNTKKDLLSVATKIIRSGELLNLNKEVPTIYIKDKVYKYDKTSGLHEKKLKPSDDQKFYVIDKDNYAGKNVQAKLEPYFQKNELKKVEQATLWMVGSKKQKQVNELIDSHLLFNPHAMDIVAVS